MHRLPLFLTTALILGSVSAPVTAVYAQETTPPEVIELEITDRVTGELHSLIGRISRALDKKQGEVATKRGLNRYARTAIDGFFLRRINWLEKTDDRLAQAQGMREVAQIHRDLDVFLDLPNRPALGEVLGESFSSQLAISVQSLEHADFIIQQIEKQGVDTRLVGSLFAESEEALLRANASFEISINSEDPKLWRITLEDHRHAKDAIKVLFGELRHLHGVLEIPQ